MRTRRLAVFAAAGAAIMGLAACGSADEKLTASAAMSADPSGRFGAGCAAMPADPAGPGSFTAMAKAPVATAVSGNPVLSTLVTAVTKANLVDSLDNADGVTVFAPTNDAFARMPAADLRKVLDDNAALTKVLTYHVVPGRLAPAQIAGTHTTLEGQTLTVTASGTTFKVNDAATVVCGNVQTENATVYIVDTVLMPTD